MQNIILHRQWVWRTLVTQHAYKVLSKKNIDMTSFRETESERRCIIAKRQQPLSSERRNEKLTES